MRDYFFFSIIDHNQLRLWSTMILKIRKEEFNGVIIERNIHEQRTQTTIKALLSFKNMLNNIYFLFKLFQSKLTKEAIIDFFWFSSKEDIMLKVTIKIFKQPLII